MSEFDEDEIQTGVMEAVSEAEPEAEPGQREGRLVIISGHQLGQIINIADAPLVVGRSPEADVVILDHGISRQHARIERRPDGTITVVDLGSTNGTLVNGEAVEAEQVLTGCEQLRFGSTVLKFTMEGSPEATFFQAQYDAVQRDSLTGCYNKRHLLERLWVELSFAQRHKRLLSVAVVEVDLLQHLVENHGYPAGETVLKAVAEIIGKEIRAEDLLGRYDGEAFVVVMRETEISETEGVVERLRQRIEETAIEHDGVPLKVTVSVGVAYGPTEEINKADDLVNAARAHLHEAL